ncbi:TetR/AcrR family transcriptional regulator [Pilimelia columellifera]|uniref:TetR/AcrR family transcriptional regulator n=1 Tax=Pilimelia columellifera subsp. columellifera TaxID=706583 RepID=A0ABP6AN18_9ACTN
MALVENKHAAGRAPAGAAVLRRHVTTAIRLAVMQELAEGGYGRLSIEAVARRAGVGKTTVYRRWSSKLEMVVEIIAEVAGRRLPVPDTGSLHGDLELIMNAVVAALAHPLASQIVPDLLAEAARTPEIAEALLATLRAHQRDIAAAVVGRAVGRGELPADADAESAVDFIVGPLYWRLAVLRAPLPDGYVGRQVQAVIEVLSGQAAPVPSG